MLSNSTTRLVDNYKERIAGTKATIFLRNGIFQINYYLGDGAYKSQSLKTSKLEEARQRARLLLAKYEYRISEGLPVHGRSLGVVIDEYLAERKKGLRDERGQPVYGSGGIKTHPQLWRHLQRVTRYFRQFAGSMSIERIGDGELSRYLAWRQELYTRVRAERDPNRAPRYIAEKTLLWELTLLKTILRWAHRQGYRGLLPLPTQGHKISQKIARPPFTDDHLKRLREGLKRWIELSKGTRNEYTALLLRDYVMILAGSGLRIGELNRLTWGAVEPFTDKKGRRNLKLAVIGKTGRRTVIPRRTVVRYFGRVRKRSGEVSPSDLVFRMPGGSEIKTLRYVFIKVLRMVGIEHNAVGETYSLYSLRHTYATMALRRRVDVYMLSRNMGASVPVIESFYGRRVTAEMGELQLGD
ncbi:MAG: hypothetical protein WCP04_06490 [Pseudomonadota bacterium]|jgi:integrase